MRGLDGKEYSVCRGGCYDFLYAHVAETSMRTGSENLAKIFLYVHTPTNSEFEFVAVVNIDKYNSFPAEGRATLENLDNIKISDIKIKTPDNPSVLKQAKLITLRRYRDYDEYCEFTRRGGRHGFILFAIKL
jgi:hypothetical protein